MAHILIVDDSAELVDFLSLLLKTQCFSVTPVTSKKDLFSCLLSKPLPDLILLDVMLGDDDGRKICSELKGNDTFNKIPVILLSASPQLLSNFSEYGAVDFIEKPFDLKAMIEKINNALSARV